MDTESTFPGAGRILVLTLLLVLAVSGVSATFLTDFDVPFSAFTLPPGSESDNNLVMNFTLNRGGDTLINGSAEPGEKLYKFSDDKTMFLNQSFDTPRGLNGYNLGEDILNVKPLYTGSRMEVISGLELENISSETVYADGGNLSDGVFQGDEVAPEPELVLRDNGSEEGLLDEEDFVVASGSLNATNFSDDVKLIDVDNDGLFDDGSDAIVRSSDSELQESDTVLRGGTDLTDFGSVGPEVSYFDVNGDGEYQDTEAVLLENGSANERLEGNGIGTLGDSEGDYLIHDGDAGLVDAANSNLSFFNTDGFNKGWFTGDKRYEPIYHEEVQDFFVNVSSTTRIGPIDVTSFNSSDNTTADLGLETMSYVNASEGRPENNTIGRNIYKVDGSTYSGSGEFYVFELAYEGDPDGVWNPEDPGDQEILVYDLDSGSEVSTGETLLYNSHPSNDNVSVDVGEEFENPQFSDYTAPNVDAEVGFMDNSSGEFEPSGDNVSVNVSLGGSSEIVNLAPNRYAGTTGGSGTFIPKGEMRFWNVTPKDTPRRDGLYVDIDTSGNITHGDVRIGEWIKTEPAGLVEPDDLDQGVSLDAFSTGKAVFTDSDRDGLYDPGEGDDRGKASDTNGRDALVTTQGDTLVLESIDSVIKPGDAGLLNFDGQYGYFENESDGRYTSTEPIIRNTGENRDRFEPGDTVVTSGEPGFHSFNKSELYVEDGEEPGFEQGSDEAIVYDSNSDGVLSRGPLSTGDRVLGFGEANLQTFRPVSRIEGVTGTGYIDRDGSGKLNTGEEILNVTLVTNGSDSDTVSGFNISNFAPSTVHNGSENYTDGNAIVNDTDRNLVFEDVLEALEIDNVASAGRSFEELIGPEEVEDGVLELFRDTGDFFFDRQDDEKIAELEYSSGSWNASGLDTALKADETFFVSFNTSSGITQEKVYRFRGSLISGSLAGGQKQSYENPSSQIIDAYPPEFTGGFTGVGSDSSDSSRLLVSIREKGIGIASASVSDEIRDFKVLRDDVSVTGETERGGDIRLELNTSIQTNATPRVELNGSIKDLAENRADKETFEFKDGLRPRLEDAEYRDLNVDGKVDTVELKFSENISYDEFKASDWNVESRNLTGLRVFEGQNPNSPVLRLDAEAEPNKTGVDSGEPLLNYTDNENLVDLHGNHLDNIEDLRVGDGAGPAIVSAETFNPDSDKETENITVGLSENLSYPASSLVADAFNLSTGTVTDVKTIVRNDSTVELSVKKLPASQDPVLELKKGFLFDDHGNSVSSNQTFSDTLDGTRPVLTSAEIDPARSNSTDTFVQLNFNEPVADTSPNTKKGVNVSRKSLEFLDTTFSDTHFVDYGEVLETVERPNVTSLVNVSDREGNKVVLEDLENVTVKTVITPVYRGWNLVSLPIATEGGRKIAEVLNTSKIEIVWTYRDGSWRSYDPEAPVNQITRFRGGRGYYLEASESFNLSASVDAVYNGEEESKGTSRKYADLSDTGQPSLVGQFQEYRQMADATSYLNASGDQVSREEAVRGPAFGGFAAKEVGPVQAQRSYEGGRRGLDLTDIKKNDVDASGFMKPGRAYWANLEGQTWTYTELE